jgi:hypothetical protein
MSILRQAVLAVVVLQFTACGTALYHHAVNVAVINTPEIDVGVFDHQEGYTRDWAHRVMRKSSNSANYSTTLTTTAAVTASSVHDARPLTIAVAIPAITDDGYFLLEIAGPSDRQEKPARFCRYGEYFPESGAKEIPVVVSATPAKGDWAVNLAIDIAAAKQAFR